jgi:hypothetical protein
MVDQNRTCGQPVSDETARTPQDEKQTQSELQSEPEGVRGREGLPWRFTLLRPSRVLGPLHALSFVEEFSEDFGSGAYGARFTVPAGSLLSAGPWAEAHGSKLKLAPQCHPKKRHFVCASGSEWPCFTRIGQRLLLA